MANWNPWHGCHKYSEGCYHCYVYRMDDKYGRDTTTVTKLKNWDKPIAKTRTGDYKIPSGSIIYTCFTSDFFIEEADEWRQAVWRIMKQRNDVMFYMITKRIHRFMECIPDDWANGYDNVTICCTMESQRQLDARLPLYLQLPIRHKEIICEPLLTDLDFHGLLDSSIEQVTAGGESGSNARICDYRWIMHIREQCMQKDIPFYFKQTGAKLIKDQRIYHIQRKDQLKQALRADINYHAKIPKYKE